MLVLTSKKYEVEETIKAIGDEEETLYEFQMQLTGKEVNEINEIIINKETIDMANKLTKLEADSKTEEAAKLQEEIIELANKNQSRFEDICFKEHKEIFKEKVGEYKYLEMVEMLFDFFWKAFIGKKAQRVNTMSSDLRKIGGK